MTDGEARAWLAQEPTLRKAIMKLYERPQEARLKSPRDKLTPYLILLPLA